MAKRKSMNRRLSRYSRSSIESAILDADMDVVDDDQPFWWQHLDNNTVRYSMRSKAFNETSRHLDSAFSIADLEDVPGGSNNEAWWKILDNSRPITVPRKSPNTTESDRPQTESAQKNLKSSDSEPEEEVRPKRRKFPLHEIAKRRSYGENAFLKALNSSKESIVSEPVVKLCRIDFKDYSVQSTRTRAASELRTSSEAKGEEKVHENNENQSLTVTDIVKVRPTFGKRNVNQNKNAFEDALNNTSEDASKSTFKTPFKSPLKSKSSRSSILKTESRKSIVNGTPIGQRRQSRLTLSFQDDSNESLNLPGPKAQSTIIETPVKAKTRKLAESDSDTEIWKPKSRMLKRLRKSLGPNIFEDILNEDDSERSIINMNNETEGSHPTKSPLKNSAVDVDISKQKSSMDLSDNEEETMLPEKSQEVTGSKSVSSIRQKRSKKQGAPTFSFAKESSISSKSLNSNNKRTVKSSVNDNANTITSEKNKILDSNSKNRISEASSASNSSETRKKTQLNRETSRVIVTMDNQDERLVSNVHKDISDSQNNLGSHNGSDQLILRLSSDTSDDAGGKDNIVAETSVTEHMNSESLQRRRPKRSSTSQRMRINSETPKVEENEINVDISLDDKEYDATPEKRVTRGRLSMKHISETVEEDNSVKNNNVLNTSRQSNILNGNKSYSLRSRSKQVTLNTSDDGADSDSTRIRNFSLQSNISTRNKRSTLGNRDHRTSNTIFDEKAKKDETAIEESVTQQNETLGDRSRTTNSSGTPEKVVAENTEENEEFLGTLRQNTELIKNKKSAPTNRRERTLSNTIVHEQAEESLRKNTEDLNAYRQNDSSIKSKKSILDRKSKRLTLTNIPGETMKKIIRSDDELLNTSRQSDVLSRSKRHTSASRNRTISETTSDEPSHFSNFISSPTVDENNDTEDTQARDASVGENKNLSDSNEKKMSNYTQHKKLNVLRKHTSFLQDSSKTENSRVTRKQSENLKRQTDQNSLIENFDEEQSEQSTKEQGHTEEEGGKKAEEEAVDVNKTRKKPSSGSEKELTSNLPMLTSGIAASADDDDIDVNIMDVSEDEKQSATSQERDDLQNSSRRSLVQPDKQGTKIQSKTSRKSIAQLSQASNAERNISEKTRNHGRHAGTTNKDKNGNLHESRAKIPNTGKSSIPVSHKNMSNVSEVQLTLDTFFKERPPDKMFQPLSNSEEALKFKKKLEEIRKQAMDKVEVRLRNKGSVISAQEKSDRPKKFAKKANGKEKQQREVNKAYLVNGKVYKPPRLPRPKPWATDRLYRFLWKVMEPKYGMTARVKSEKFILRLADAVTVIRKAKKYEQYEDLLNNLMKETARLGIIRTRNDFYHFSHDFLPNEFWVKVTPMLLPGNKKNIPYDTSTLNEPLLDS